MKENEIKEEMKKYDMCDEMMAACLFISPSTFKRKMNGKAYFNANEIKMMSIFLNLDAKRVFSIFID